MKFWGHYLSAMEIITNILASHKGIYLFYNPPANYKKLSFFLLALMWMYYLKLIGNALINCKLQHPPHCDFPPPPLSLQHLSFWGLVPSNFHLSLEQNWVQILFPRAGVASQKPYSEKKCLNREEKRHGVWPFIKTVTFHDTAVASHTDGFLEVWEQIDFFYLLYKMQISNFC